MMHSWIHFIIRFTDESIQPSESKEGGSVSKLWGGRFTEEAEAWVEEFEHPSPSINN